MQTTLSFKHEGKTYTSKQFDFEALCLINDKHGDDNKGVFRMTADAVDYMFRESEGAGIIKELSPAVRARLCREAWEMYADAIKNG